MSDNFGFTLHSTLNKEELDKLLDVEFENTPSVTFRTPQGRQVRYIQCDVLDKIRAEIAEYGSLWVEYKITGRSDKDIEQLVRDVLKQAKEQVFDVIDKYKEESESVE